MEQFDLGRPEIFEDFGPWMLGKKNGRRRNVNPAKGSTTQNFPAGNAKLAEGKGKAIEPRAGEGRSDTNKTTGPKRGNRFEALNLDKQSVEDTLTGAMRGKKDLISIKDPRPIVPEASEPIKKRRPPMALRSQGHQPAMNPRPNHK